MPSVASGKVQATDGDPDLRYLVLHRVTWRNAKTMPGSKVVMANCGHSGKVGRTWCDGGAADSQVGIRVGYLAL